MARRKVVYTKFATSYAQQINLLKSRGVIIEDIEKAKEYLSDIGYYRLGYYLFPFEQTYPILDYRRSHDVIPGTRIEDVVAFYYYDLDLRNILNRYLSTRAICRQLSGFKSEESNNGSNGIISTCTSPANSSGTKALNVCISAGCNAPVSASRTIEMVPPVKRSNTLIFRMSLIRLQRYKKIQCRANLFYKKFFICLNLSTLNRQKHQKN